MDPASVVGLVAACASLTKTCIGVAKSLNDIAQVYKDAEVDILATASQCKITEFAWKRLEDWANKYLVHLSNHDEVLDMLQHIIYTGRIFLDALEKDLAKATSKPSNFKRRTNVSWNTKGLKQHQIRIQTHNSALQVLLQVVSL